MNGYLILIYKNMLSKTKLKAFTLIELLVVITILAIISVVAYTNFSWSTDKAKNSKKLNDISSIETWLNMFFQDKNYYPMPSAYDSATNVWGYNSAVAAQLNNTFTWSKNWTEFDWTTFYWSGWWIVYLSWSSTSQIWAKWVVDSSVLSKQYLSQELVDPNLKDTKVGATKTFKDYWVGKYVYWVYAKNNSDWSVTSQKWTAYNVAITIKDDQKWFMTKLIWNFDKTACSGVACPNSLIWSWTSNVNLNDGDSSFTGSSTNPNERIPYAIAWF